MFKQKYLCFGRIEFSLTSGMELAFLKNVAVAFYMMMLFQLTENVNLGFFSSTNL